MDGLYSLFSNLQVTEEMAMEYARQNDNMPWMETSAKLDENIDHLFMVLTSLLKDRADLERARATCDGETLPSSISGVARQGTIVLRVGDERRDSCCGRITNWFRSFNT